jgi:hypothetical protein
MLWHPSGAPTISRKLPVELCRGFPVFAAALMPSAGIILTYIFWSKRS